jgi:phospholipid transport system substrate-binding protein
MGQPKHMSRRVFNRLIAAVIGVVLLSAPASAQDEGPESVVERLNDALLDVMQAADELGYAGRFERLEPVLTELFNFPFMARIAIGTTWRELGEPERAQLVDLFTQMSIANFAARFDGYGGERFEIVGQEPGPREAVLVSSRLVLPDDDPVGLDYLLREFDGDWQIIDVLLDATFSELARQRAEFAAILRDGGVPGLAASLERQIDRLAAEG